MIDAPCNLDQPLLLSRKRQDIRLACHSDN